MRRRLPAPAAVGLHARALTQFVLLRNRLGLRRPITPSARYATHGVARGLSARLSWPSCLDSCAAVTTRRGGASRAAAHRTRAAPRRATTRARRRQPDGYGNICTDGEQAVAGGSVEPVEPGPTLPCPDRDRRLRRARADEAAGVGLGAEPTPARPATFGAVCAVGEFRVLWLADVLSLLGDQLARVALAVLVYGRTGSALLTGLVYALSFLPALVGGALRPGIPITLALLAVSGLGTAFQLAANAAFVQAVPAAVRGQVFGLAQAGIITVQGAAILLAGAVASRLAPALVVAGAGGLGTAAAARLIWSLSRAERAAAGRVGGRPVARRSSSAVDGAP